MREDQAAGLRRLFSARSARVLLVADCAWPRRGWLALNLAAAFARAGEQTVVLDAEAESIAALWGARCRYELAHVLDGDRSLVDVIVPGPESSVVLPMRRAAATLAQRGRAGQSVLARVLERFVEHDGLLIVPVSPNGLALALWHFGAAEILFCVGEGSTATTSAYTSIKALLARRPRPSLRVVFSSSDEALGVQGRFEHLGEIVKRFLGAQLSLAGALPSADFSYGTAGRTLFDDAPTGASVIEALALDIGTWRLPRLEFGVGSVTRHSSQVVTI
jgi:flagellar biosynthesis protein FlhG